MWDPITKTYIRKPRRKFNGIDRFHCSDKKNCHHSVYRTDIFTLELKCNFINTKAELKYWNLLGPNGLYRGKTLTELRNKLYELIRKYDLKRLSDKCFYRDQILIYTDNILKAKGILQDEFIITEEFKNDRSIRSFTILDFFIIQEPEGWTDKTDISDMHECMTNVMNKYFRPNERVYLSPYQFNRKIVKKNNTEDCIMPETYSEYKTIWKPCYYGGAAFANRNILYDEPIIEYDRKSAYLYEYFMPHMSGSLQLIDSNLWTQWIDNMNIANSLGRYKITFEIEHRFLNVYNRSKKDWKFETEYTETFTFLNTDLKIFLNSAKIKSIECLFLYEYKTSLLPKPVIDHIVNCFLDKETYKDDLHKAIANANYGSLCMDLTNEQFKKLKEHPWYCPMWGFEIAAYARKHLFECGSKLDGWIYSDTDSIFCRKTEKNEVIINEYNNFMQKVIKRACEPDYYNLDFDKLNKLGLYKFETEIKQMIIRGVKTYAYIDVEGNFIQKASGMCKDAKNTWKDWISNKKLDYGNRITKTVTKDGYFEDKEDLNVDLNVKATAIVSNIEINKKYNNFDIHWNTSKLNVNKNVVF